MLRPNAFALTFAVTAAAAAALVLWPGWPAGRTADRVGSGFAYAHRNVPIASNDIVLVEIDDAAVAELGPWPWDAATIRKFFEAPFASALLVVPMVSPGDFEFARDSEAVFWSGMKGTRSASPVKPFDPTQPDVLVAGTISNHPAGGQGELLRISDIKYEVIDKRLPEWRAEVLRSLAYRYVRRYGDATKEQFVERALGPYWLKSDELTRLAEFWFAQANAAARAVTAAQAKGFDKGSFPQLAEADYVYAAPDADDSSPAGFLGESPVGRPSCEAAVLSFQDKPLVRLGAVAAAAGGGGLRFEGRTLVVTRPTGKGVRFNLGPDGAFPPDWTGNAGVAWDAGFRKFSAGNLIEAANAKRALWKGYCDYEALIGQNAMPKLVDAYEKAASALDRPAMAEASKRISVRMRALQEFFGLEKPSTEAAEPGKSASKPERPPVTTGALIGLEYDYQTVSSSIEDAFENHVVVIAPTAVQFTKVRSPWGEDLPEAALEVAILNSGVTGQAVQMPPAWMWYAFAVAGGFVAAFLAARFGILRALLPCAAIGGVLFYLWFSLFGDHRMLLGASCLVPLPLCLVAGGAAYAATVGQRRRVLRRLLGNHVSPEALGRAVKMGGVDVFRTVPQAAVLAVEFDGNGYYASIDRYVATVRDAIFSLDGVILEGTTELEGAFGWMGTGQPLDSAVSAVMSARKRLKLVGEKLRGEGVGALELRCGVASGEASLSAGKVSQNTVRARGPAFDRAREAVIAARRWKAGIVAVAEDAPALASAHELRRLDAEGRFFEVLERKGALSVAMRKVRETYEKALDELAAGRNDEAKKLLEQNLAIIEDGPSRELLKQLTNRPDTGAPAS